MPKKKPKESEDLMLSLTDPEMETELHSSPSNTRRLEREVAGIPNHPPTTLPKSTVNTQLPQRPDRRPSPGGKGQSQQQRRPRSPVAETTLSSNPKRYPTTGGGGDISRSSYTGGDTSHDSGSRSRSEGRSQYTQRSLPRNVVVDESTDHHGKSPQTSPHSVSIQTETTHWPGGPSGTHGMQMGPGPGTSGPPPQMDYVPQQFHPSPGAQFPIPPPPPGSWPGGGSVGVVGPIPGLPTPGSDYYPNVQMVRYPLPPNIQPHMQQPDFLRQGGTPFTMPLNMQYGSNRSLDIYSPSPPSTTASDLGGKKKKSKNPFVRMSHKVQKTVGIKKPRRASSLPAGLDARRMNYPDSLSSVPPSIERSSTPEPSTRYPHMPDYSQPPGSVPGGQHPGDRHHQPVNYEPNWSPLAFPASGEKTRIPGEKTRDTPGMQQQIPTKSGSTHQQHPPASGTMGSVNPPDPSLAPGASGGGSKTRFVPNQDLYRITEQSAESDVYPMMVAAEVHGDRKDKKKKSRKHRSHGNVSHGSADRRRDHKRRAAGLDDNDHDDDDSAPLIRKDDHRKMERGSTNRAGTAPLGSSSEERAKRAMSEKEPLGNHQKVPLWKKYGTFGETDQFAKDNRQQVLEVFGAGISRARKIWTLTISLVSIFCLALYFSIFTKQFTMNDGVGTSPKDGKGTFPKYTHAVSYILISSFGILLSPILACEIRKVALRFQMISGLVVMGIAAIMTGVTLMFAANRNVILNAAMLFLGAMAGMGAAMVLPSAWCGTLYAVSMFTERMMIAAITLSFALSCFFGPMISHFATTGAHLAIPYFVLGSVLIILAGASVLLFNPLRNQQEYRLASSFTFRELAKMGRFWILFAMVSIASSSTVFFYLHLWFRFMQATEKMYILAIVMTVLAIIAICSAFWVGYFPKTSSILLGTFFDAMLGFFLIGPFPHLGLSSENLTVFIVSAVFLALGILPQWVLCCRQLFLFVWCQDYSQEIDSISMVAGFLASGTFIGILIGGAAGIAALHTIGYGWMSAVLMFAQILQILFFVLFKWLPTEARAPTRGMLGLKPKSSGPERGLVSPAMQKRTNNKQPFDRIVERLSGRRGRSRTKNQPGEDYPYGEIGRSGL